MSMNKNKKSLLRFNFNMVEVALAMLVISLGLSTVLVLFPAGMKASRQAEEENHLVEAAEAMESYIRMNYSTANKLPDVLTCDSSDGTGDSVVESKFGLTSSANKNSSIIRLNNNTAHAFLYRKLTEADGQVITEFSCVVRLLRADLRKGIESTVQSGDHANAIAYFPVASGSSDVSVTYKGSGGNDDTVNFKKITAASSNAGFAKASSDNLEYFRVINMEISYPADKPYSARKKRVFRLEIFDENYEPKGNTP